MRAIAPPGQIANPPRREKLPLEEREERAAGGADFVRSLERGLAVIRAFDAEHPALTLSEVARATGLTRAAARRIDEDLRAVAPAGGSGWRTPYSAQLSPDHSNT